MEVDDVADSEDNTWRRHSPNQLQMVRSGNEKANLEETECMQLDFKHDGSNARQIKPNKSILTTTTPFFANQNLPIWTYDSVMLPQFGPQKFQRKKFSSPITQPQEAGSSNSSGPYRLGRSADMDFLDEVREVISPSRCLGDIEMEQNSAESMLSVEDDSVFSFVECLEDIEMDKTPAKSKLGLITQFDKIILPSDCRDDFNSQKQLTKQFANEAKVQRDTVKNRSGDISESDRNPSLIECMNKMRMEQNSSDNESSFADGGYVTPSESLNATKTSQISASSARKGVKRKISVLLTKCVDDIGMAQKSTSLMSNEVKDDKNMLEISSEIRSESEECVSPSESLDATEIVQLSVSNAKEGIKRKNSVLLTKCVDDIGMAQESTSLMSNEVKDDKNMLEISSERRSESEECVSPSESLDATEIVQLSVSNAKEGIKRKNSVLLTECLDHFGMAQESISSMPNDVKDDRNMLETSSKSKSEAEGSVSPSESLGATEITQISVSNAKRRVECKNSISLTECGVDTKMAQESPSKKANEVKEDEKILKTSSETGSEADRSVSPSTQKSVSNAKRGVKRKISEVYRVDKNSEEAVRSSEEESQILRRSERIKNYSSPPLILNRPRRSNAAYNPK